MRTSWGPALATERDIEKRTIPGTAGVPRSRWGLALFVSVFMHAAAMLLMAHVIFRAVRQGSPEIVFDVNLLRPSTGEKDGRTRKKEPMPKPVRVRASQVRTVERSKAPRRAASKSGKAKAPAKVIATVGGRSSVYGARTPAARAAAVRKWGGSRGSENAVAEGLRWLALHQDDDGRWDADNFDKHCGDAPEPCSGPGDRNVDVAVTGLAMLAFLGAGNTPTQGHYRKTVERAEHFLVGVQQKDGVFGTRYRLHMYDQGIATLALAEALALTKDDRLKGPLQKAVDFICAAQQAEGGWDYTSAPTGRDDTSVTGWQLMALKSARTAGLRVPNATIRRAIHHFQTCTNKDGAVRYTNKDSRTTLAMTAVGMVCRQFLGWPRDNEILRSAARRLAAAPPRWAQAEDRKTFGMYYWYYGTLAMFQMGQHYWEIWNTHMRDMLVEHQVRAGHARGSWDPVSLGSRRGGRIYSTAINVLNLEVYYRYLPLYEIHGADAVVALAEVVRDEDGRVRLDVADVLLTLGPPAASTLANIFDDSPTSLRRRIARFLGTVQTEETLRALRKAGNDKDTFVRLAAAEALAARRDPAALAILRALMKDDNDFVRSQTVKALSDWHSREAVELLLEALADRQPFIVEKTAKSLRRICGRDFGLRRGQTQEQRQRSIQAWRQWWQQHRSSWTRATVSPPKTAK